MIAGSPSPVRRILVCDEERHIVRLLQVNLQRQGYEVICAYRASEGIECLERESFHMAVLSDEALLRWIRANEKTKGRLKIVWLGSKETPDDHDGPPEADLYLTKPFNPMDLFR